MIIAAVVILVLVSIIILLVRTVIKLENNLPTCIITDSPCYNNIECKDCNVYKNSEYYKED